MSTADRASRVFESAKERGTVAFGKKLTAFEYILNQFPGDVSWVNISETTIDFMDGSLIVIKGNDENFYHQIQGRRC